LVSETVSILAMIRLMLYPMVLSDIRAACRADRVEHGTMAKMLRRQERRNLTHFEA
jgi:hypothetical protein